ncbi:MAG: four helix bundle protein [Chlorobiaceae bacterium]|nr:four helix bundle protein [Chlorobiaceae bacterium]
MQQDNSPYITGRTFQFAIRIVALCQCLEKEGAVSKVLSTQLLKSGTSVGANVEEAQAGQSKADFTAKMSIARKEARETNYWLRLLKESQILRSTDLDFLLEESDQLIRILTSIVKSAQKNKC